MAVPVDEVIGARELRNLDKASVKAVPPEIDPDFIAGIFRSGETDILEIRTAALLKE